MILPMVGWRWRWSSRRCGTAWAHASSCPPRRIPLSGSSPKARRISILLLKEAPPLPAKADPFVWLFSESTGRVLVSVKRGTERDLASLCRTNEIKLTRLGEVTAEEDATLEVVGQFTLPLARIREAWQSPLPAAMAQ